MKNKLRNITEEEIDQVNDQEPLKEASENVFAQFFSKGGITAEAATGALPFILFLALLGMLYIANRNYAEKNIRDIEKINKEVKELSYDYKTTKAELAYRSTLTQVAKQADTLGIKESLLPPEKITVQEDGQHDH